MYFAKPAVSIGTSGLSCHVTDEIENWPEKGTEERFLSCVAPAHLFRKAASGPWFVCISPVGAAWVSLLDVLCVSGALGFPAQQPGKSRLSKSQSHLCSDCLLCKDPFQSIFNLNGTAAWPGSSFSLPFLEVHDVGVGMLVTKCFMKLYYWRIWKMRSGLCFIEFSVSYHYCLPCSCWLSRSAMSSLNFNHFFLLCHVLQYLFLLKMFFFLPLIHTISASDLSQA